MWTICKKEWIQFFNSLTNYLALILFLLLTGLLLFVFPDNNILDFGYTSLNNFFSLAPFLFLFLIPTITMRSMAEEYKLGTFEVLKTLPIKLWHIIFGKFLGSLIVSVIAFIPTIVYLFSLQHLSSIGGIDIGETIGSYIGLLLLCCVYTAVGICVSSFTNNTVVAFITSAFICFLLFNGFEAISVLPFFKSNGDYYIQMLGIKFHYHSISRGVVDIRDIIYFFVSTVFFLLIALRHLTKP